MKNSLKNLLLSTSILGGIITATIPSQAQTVQAVAWPGGAYGFKAQLPGVASSPQGVIHKCFLITGISINTSQSLITSYANAPQNPIVLELSFDNTFNQPNLYNGIHLKFSTNDGPGGTNILTAMTDTLFPADQKWHCFGITWDSSNWDPNWGLAGRYAIAGHLDGVPLVWNQFYTGGGFTPTAFSTDYSYGGVWNNWAISAELDSTGQPHNFYTNESAQFFVDLAAVDYTLIMNAVPKIAGFGTINQATGKYAPLRLGPQCLIPFQRAPVACFRGDYRTYLTSLGSIFSFAVPQGYLGPGPANDDPFIALWTPGYYP